MHRPVFRLAAPCLGLALAACGGGGEAEPGGLPAGSGGVPIVDFDTPEFRASTGLAAINASQAYLAGETGAGVRVAVIDTGIDLDHPDLAGAIDPASTDIVSGNPALVDDSDGHGTAVAGIIAARRNGQGTHGVAFDATLLAVRADTPGTCPTVCTYAPADLARASTYAVQHGAQVLNFSLSGGQSPDLVAALENAAAADAVLVVAAGNDSAADPALPGRNASQAGYDGQMIVVGGVDGGNAIAPFSNRAGVARDFFLVAPGVGIQTTGLGGGVTTLHGTSAAAPLVSGAAAVLIDRWPYLTAEQIVAILLDTATDLGAPGPDPVYGRGLLNLAGAIAPAGQPVVPAGATAAEGGVPLQATSLRLGPAFGDALAGDTPLSRAIVLDRFTRAYLVDLAERVRADPGTLALDRWLVRDDTIEVVDLAPAPATSLRIVQSVEPLEHLDLLADPTAGEDDTAFALTSRVSDGVTIRAFSGHGIGQAFGLRAEPAVATAGFVTEGALASPFLGMLEDEAGLAVDTALGQDTVLALGFAADGLGLDDDGQGRAGYAAELRRRLPAGGAIGLQAGVLEEQGSLLETEGEAAFGFGDPARTRFLGLSGTVPLAGGAALHAGYAAGWTDAADSLLLRDIADLRSDAFSLGLTAPGPFAHDRLALGVSQPLRVGQGRATLDVPVGRAMDGTILRQRETVSLVPSGRQLDLELGYGIDLDAGQSLQLNAVTQIEPGHDADADPVFSAGARYRVRF